MPEVIEELLFDDIDSLTSFGAPWVKICSSGSMTHNFFQVSTVKRRWASTKNYDCIHTAGFGIKKTYTLDKWDGVSPVKISYRAEALIFKLGLTVTGPAGTLQNKVGFKEYSAMIQPDLETKQFTILFNTRGVKDSKSGFYRIDWVKFEQARTFVEPSPEPEPISEPEPIPEPEKGLTLDQKIGIIVGGIAVAIGIAFGAVLAQKPR